MVIKPELPETPTLLAYSAGVFVLWYITTAFHSWYRMRHIPGPFLASFSYLWHFYITWTDQTGPVFSDLHNRYANGGPFVRISPSYVVTNDPDALRHFASARGSYGKDEWWRATQFHKDYGNIASTLDLELHDSMKAKSASGYSGREAGAEFEPAIDSQIVALKQLISRKFLSVGDRLREADLPRLMRLLTIDVVTRLGYGKSWGHLDEAEDVTGYVGYLDNSMRTITIVLDMPLLRRVFCSKVALTLFAPRETDKTGVGVAIGKIHGLIAERFATDAKSKTWNDMIGGFMRNGMTQQEVEGEANMQILAGTETTSTALTSILMHLATSPHAYARLKSEIYRAAMTTENTHNPSDGPVITYEQALKLPYLQAVIWEGFRMKVPVNYGHYKSVPGPGGDTVLGHFLPAGTAVGHNSLALTRNAKVFGRDVHLFRPERFLAPVHGGDDSDDETRARRMRALDIVFGGGRFACSGKQVALYELNKVIFEMMRAFDFQVVNPSNAWREIHYGTPRFTGMKVRIMEADWSCYSSRFR